MGSRTHRSPGDSFGSLGRPSPDSQSSAVLSLLSHARTLRVPYGEQKRLLAQALLADPHFAETGELLQTMEKGDDAEGLRRGVHLWCIPPSMASPRQCCTRWSTCTSFQGPFVPMDDQLLGQDRLGPDYVLHQGIYEEIRQHLPYGPSPYAPADERRTAYIVAGFKVLDATFQDVMENSWKDWTGARSLYINLAHEFGLHRFSLYRRSRPRNDFSTFSYVLLVECRAVTSENALRLLDFVQRFRAHRMSGYLSVYNARHLALESYSRDVSLFSPSLHGGSDWWNSTSESTSSEDNPRSHGVLRSSVAVSSTRMQPMPAVEIVPTSSAKRFVTTASAAYSSHGRNGTTMTPIYENLAGCHQVEFDVNMTCQSCEAQVRQSLERLGVRDMVIDVEKQIVVVDTDIPFTKVQEAIQSTGKKAVLKGFGSSAGKATPSVAAAVSEMSGPSGILGVVRFTQAAEGSCIIDGVIDGLSKGATHKLRIHELGDLSNGYADILPVDLQGEGFVVMTGDYGQGVNEDGDDGCTKYGSLGEIDVDENGRSVFRRTNDTVKVWEIIGRSLVVCSDLACGIIARASGIAQNPKRICACDGVSVWDERDTAGSKKS
ncbi:hypothetical protein HPB48_022779 [Haemaphysalis longicornis]|uniref:HMA domain-containing protein n=1 Tax=Haemaphysalis longicornis TaxID=44386 RepID=A0A9J6H0N2_HAELO|nr:hypothetical protein HPB48_022779 [Haemaphysalis longicornis]